MKPNLPKLQAQYNAMVAKAEANDYKMSETFFDIMAELAKVVKALGGKV